MQTSLRVALFATQFCDKKNRALSDGITHRVDLAIIINAKHILLDGFGLTIRVSSEFSK